jgi:hypothetical protein
MRGNQHERRRSLKSNPAFDADNRIPDMNAPPHAESFPEGMNGLHEGNPVHALAVKGNRDAFLESEDNLFVIPAKAGIQITGPRLAPG